MKHLFLALFASQLLFSHTGLAATAAKDSKPITLECSPQGKGTVEFNAVGKPSAIKIHGKGTAPKGTLKIVGTKVSGSITANMDSLDTGIELRNKHMKEKYLETKQYPEAKVTIKDLDLPKEITNENFKLSAVPFQGTLSLHGVEKPIKGLIDIERSKERVKFDAKFDLKISDYKINLPSFAGITMAENVSVIVNSESQLAQGL